MQKRLLVWLLPVLLGWQMVDSTELPFTLSVQDEYNLTQTVYDHHFKTIPQNPNVYKLETTYADANLTEASGEVQPNQQLTIIGAVVNDKKDLVFQLDTGLFIAADTRIIFDDAIVSETPTDASYWLKKDFRLLTSAIANQAKQVDSDLQAYQPVTISKLAQTAKGDFAYIDDKGWVAMSDLSEDDNRMEAVQELLTSKYNKHNLGIYVKQLSTNQTASVNQEQPFYSASIAKLPILYYVQEQLDSGTISTEDKLAYTAESMTFPGAYVVGGSGSLPKTPDNKEYLLGELIDKTAKESDNVASNLLSYYVTKQFNADFYQQITSVIGERWDMVSRETSARLAGEMMEVLYEQDGYVLESLKTTQFDHQRISKDIAVPVAHKIGDADDVKHDVAVVYSDSPFVLSIFTDKSSYDEISQIANDIYGILK